MFRNSGGFSLVELSIILVIFGGLAAASTMLGSKWVEGSEVQTTKQNIETVEAAVDAYVRLNERLPCPASDSVAPTNAAFGRDTSAADGLCSDATLAAGQVVKGAVPFQTLGVGKSLAYDAWGNRLDFYVDRRVTTEDAFINLYPAGDTSIGDIEVQDMAGGQRTGKAVMAIVSHGARAHGAVNRSGTALTLTDPNAKEVENATIDRVIVQGMAGKGADGREFDDIVAYKLRSQLASSNVNASVSCPAQAVNWTVGADSCAGSVGELAAGEAVLVSDITDPITGSVIVRCLDNETLSQSAANCLPSAVDCAAGTVNWTVDAACAGSATATVHGASTGVISNTTGGRTGSASFSCNNGSYSVLPGSVCGNNCTAGTETWGACTQTYGALNHGSNSLLTDSTLVDTGNVTVTCTNGSISKSGASCNVSGCGAATLSWGGGCSANIGGPESNGFSAGVTNSASGYAGSATATCTAGAWVLSGTSCNAHCTAQAVNWTVSGQTCTQSVGALSHGAGTSITDSVQDSTGGVTVTCNNGALNQSGATCVTRCPAGTANWTVSGNNCTGSYPAIAHGGASSSTDSAAPTTGAVNLSCTNGVVGQSGATCLAGCPAGTGNWSVGLACTVASGTTWTVGANTCTVPSNVNITHGNTGGATDATAPTTGVASWSCNDGTATIQGGATCSVPANCTVAAGTTWTVGANTCSVPSNTNITHGSTGNTTDATAPTTGTATWSCNNGTTTIQGGATCNVPANCTGTPWGTINHGNSVTAWNTTASCGGCASQTRTCTNGVLSGTFTATACNNASCSGCPGTMVSGAIAPCCHTVPASAHGTVIDASGGWDNAGGACGGGNYGGGGTITCSNGTWTPAGACWFSGGDGACFTKGTRVLMADGSTKPIEAVQIGDAVKGRGGINRVIGLKPTRAGDRAIYTINGVLQTTADHPALTERGWAVISRELYADRYYGRTMPVVDAEGTTVRRALTAVPPSQIYEYGVGDRIAFGESGFVTIEFITRESVAADTPLFTLELDGDGTMQLEGGYVYTGLGITSEKSEQ